MEPKTLLEHIRQTWPDAEQIARNAIPRPELSARHTNLFEIINTINPNKEILVFRKTGLTLDYIEEVLTLFLSKNNMRVTSPPRTTLHALSQEEVIKIGQTERRIIGLYGKSERTDDGFKQLGEIHYIIYYAETGLMILHSSSEELRWTPQ